MSTYSYSGQVVHQGTRQGISGLRVEAWDESRVCTDLVSAAFTDASGSFTITVDDGVVRDLFLGRVATLYFKVFSEIRAIANTSGALTWAVPAGNDSGRIEVPRLEEPISKDKPAPFTVRGRVLRSGTGPVAGVTVKAAHKTLRSEVALGSAATDAAGRYQIRYSPEALQALGKQRPDLVLHVLGTGGDTLGDSPVVFQAPVTATLDVTVGPSAYAGQAESDAILAVLTRTAGSIGAANLSAGDQAFLVSAEGLDAGALATLVAAAQLAQTAGGASGADLDGNALAVYAAGRKGIPVSAVGIFRVPPARLEAAISAAVAGNIIPVSSDTSVASVVTLVQQTAIAAALVPSADGLVATAGDVLGTVLSDAPTQQLFLQLYLGRTSTGQFWSDLATNASFSQTGRVAALQLAFDVADVGAQHLPLVKAIVVGQVAGTVTTLRDLARLDVADWTGILNQSYGGAVIGAPASTPGATLADKIANYAGSLTSALAARFPTPAIAGRLAKLNRPADADVITFFSQNPDFEFASGRVAAYLAANPRATAGLGQPDAAVKALKARERVFKLARTFEESDPLIQAGIDSARAVEEIGAAAFHAQFDATIGSAAAQAILKNACFVTAAVGLLQSRHSAKFNATAARVLPALSLVQNPVLQPPTGGQSTNDPSQPVYLAPEMADWPTLFGTVDLCTCDECASVYGPAAYLVDVLDFLAGVDSDVTYVSGGQTRHYTARDLLIGPSASTEGFGLVGRRPDIGHILLNCDNADTPVPYIDLLNEVLEYKVAAMVGPTVDFADGAATTGASADLSTNRQILPAELPAYTAAYTALAAATYPWSLPFDRAAQEAMAHLAMLGVPAATLMQTFTPPSVSAPEAAAEIAAVSLGLLPPDRAIIVGAPIGGAPSGGASDWGLTDPANWQTQLLVVGTFLNATGMVYADLLELLDAALFTPFLAAGALGPTIGLITPLPAGSDCDPMNLTIVGLDPAKLSQLWPLVHRFLRLRNKLGLTTTELDKMMAQFANVICHVDVSSGTFTASSTLAAGTPLLLSSTTALPSPLAAATLYYVVNPTADTFQLAATSGGAPIALTDQGSGVITFSRTVVVSQVDVPSSTLTCGVGLALGTQVVAASTGALPSPLTTGTTYYVVNPAGAACQLAATAGGPAIALADAGSGVVTLSLAGGGAVVSIDDAMLERLSAIMTLREELGTPVVEMLSWWGPVDRRPSPLSNQTSLFAQRFLNSALSNATDDEALFTVLADRALPTTAAPAGSPALGDHAARVAAASQLSGADYALLTDGTTSPVVLGLPSEVSAGAPLTLDNVSHVFRVASLARALKLSVADLLELRALSGIDPFNAADLTQATVFVKTAKQVEQSPFSVSELAYLLRGLAPSTTAFSLVTAQAASFLADLAPELTKIVSDTTFTSTTTGDPAADDPTGALTTKVLSAILPLQLPTGSPGVDVTSALQAIETTTGIDTAFSFLGTALASQLAADITSSTPLATRYGYAAAQLLLYQRRTQGIALVERKLAAALKLDRAIVSGLCETWLTSSRPGPTTLTAIEDFLPRATPDGTGSPPTDDDLTLWRTTSYLRLQKAATLIQKLRIRSIELPVLLPAPVGQGIVDLNALPASPGVVIAPNTALFTSWQRLVDTFAVRGRLRGGPTALFDLIAEAVAAPPPSPPSPPPGTFLAALCQSTGWSNADVVAVTTFYGMTLADFQKETGYVTLANAFDALSRLGTSAASAITWAKSFFVAIDHALPNYSTGPYSAGTATDIKKAAKGKFDNAGWLAAEKPVSDGLRDAQRAALVAYLVSNATYTPSGGTSKVRQYATDNDLYGDLLVDVDTSPSVMTSRLKLAMGSVQLFVQRCLLGLEQVTLDPEDAENWAWMRRYRVWEANRQIFLYPENWIVPELRDDKTELFKKLEGALAKQAVTADTVADAFNTYLEGFLELANIEVVATCYQPSGDEYDDDIVHVIGRTRGTPQDYYYRRRIGLQYWTGWEKISASIDGTVVLPVVFERRFFLFWPTIKVASDPGATSATVPATGDTVAQPPQRVEIQVAWSERKHAQWTGKKLALGSVVAEVAEWNNLLTFSDFDPSTFLLFDTVVDEPAGTVRVRVGAADPHNGRFLYVGEATWNVCGETATCISYSPLAIWSPAFPDGTVPVDNQPSYSSGAGLAIDEGATDLVAGTPPGATCQILTRTVTPYSLVFSRQTNRFGTAYPFFLKDSTATLFVEEKEVWHLVGLPKTGHLFDWPSTAYRFLPHYQPYVCTFIKALNRYGFTGSQRWANQVVSLQSPSATLFEGTNPPYVPWNNVVKPYPVADVDFSFGGAYSVYNWETFFHIPLLVATRLSQNQQFEDAHTWFLTMFDPTAPGSGPVPGRYWKVRPFWENVDLATLAGQIASQPTLPGAQLIDALLNQEDEPLTWDFQAQVEAWRRDPFNPHLVARTRPIAYQKTVVMRFLDNLIAWGDSLFRQDTIESINEATQLYILAAEVLGPRPTMVEAPDPPAPTTYWGLAQAGLDAFGDAVIETESLVSTPPDTLISCPYGTSTPSMKGVLYFCVPQNPQLLSYWDTVADRLFKIRHSMNIQGVVQQLPLFEPPIDPALLVAAAAAGLSIDSVLDSVNGPTPVYRFAALMPKALEVAAGVAQLGASLLSALEKSDAEGMATLRSGQELALLQLMRDVKQRQVDEAQANVDALTQAEALVVAKQTYYHSRVLVSPGEVAALETSAAATVLQATSQAIVAAGGTAQAFPTSYTGVVGPLPTELVAEGGENIGSGLKTAGDALGISATILHEEASVTATLAGYQRRMDDWQFQGGLADVELQQVKQQLLAAQIRLDIATKELADHDQQIANAQAIDDYLRGKFTNQALYDWMSGQIATTYFQSYQRAFDIAKRAERAYQLELALPNASFVNPGNWDNLRQGLLAGEKLQYDLRRMELSYLDENVRELEISKHVSLAQSFPDLLFTLATTGTATVPLSETLFDLDYPGHYLRRLRTVSVTLPNVSGPYTSVNCTLTQTTSSIRKDTLASPYQATAGVIPASSQITPSTPIKQIVTSGGVNDAGLFELNFHDERYLPFEGTGAVCTFQVDLPPTSNPFDVSRLEDLVLHLRYTARYGGNAFRDNVVKPTLSAKGSWLIRVAADRATAWYAFMNPAQGASPTLSLDLSAEQFPYLPGGGPVTITQIQAVAQGPAFQVQGAQQPATLAFTVTPPGGSAAPFTVTAPAWATFSGSPLSLGTWTLTLPAGTGVSGLVELWIIVSYTMGS